MVKSAPINGSIIIHNPDKSTDEFYAVTDTEHIKIAENDKKNENIPSDTNTMSDLINHFGKLAFKDDVNLDTIDMNLASPTENGLMSKTDKAKLDKIPDTGFFVDDTLSNESKNPVQNKVITAELEKRKIVVDNELNRESTNPIQNKVVTTALEGKLSYSIGSEQPRTPGTFWIKVK